MPSRNSATGGVSVTPRPLFDYRREFLLTEDELTGGRILDCPGGASPADLARHSAVPGTVAHAVRVRRRAVRAQSALAAPSRSITTSVMTCETPTPTLIGSA